jgi:hypothetical protein
MVFSSPGDHRPDGRTGVLAATRTARLVAAL